MAGPQTSDEELTAHWQAVVAATTRLQRLVDKDLEASGVPAAWFPVLDRLLRAPEHRLPMSTLARELTMTSGGFSKLADRMAHDGLIDRRGTSDDRRVVHATLTADGVRLARQVRATYLRALRTHVLPTTDGAGLAAAAQALTELAAVHSEADEAAEPMVAGERDPALPDRRGRGRVSN